MPDAAHPSPFCQMLPLSPSPPPPPTLFRPLASGKREKKKAFFSLEKSLLALLIEPCINAKGKKKVDRARFPMFAFLFPIACSAYTSSPFPELIWTGPSHVEFPEHVTRQKLNYRELLEVWQSEWCSVTFFPPPGVSRISLPRKHAWINLRQATVAYRDKRVWVLTIRSMDTLTIAEKHCHYRFDKNTFSIFFT